MGIASQSSKVSNSNISFMTNFIKTCVYRVLHASLDFLVCGSKYTIGLGDITIGLNQKEIQFIRSMVFHVVKNIDLLKE